MGLEPAKKVRLDTTEPLGSTIRMPDASIARIYPLTWPFHRGYGGKPRPSWEVASTLLTEPALQPLDPFFHPLFIKHTELNCILTAEFSQYFPVLDGRFWSASHIGLIKLFRNFSLSGFGSTAVKSWQLREEAGLSCSLAPGRVRM